MTPELLSLSNLLAWVMQSACIALAATVATRLLPMRSAELRYTMWRIALVACFAMPWLPLAGGWERDAVATGAPVLAVAFESFGVVRTATRPAAAVPWSSIAWGVLGLVVIVRTIWLFAGMLRLRRLRRAAAAVDGEEFAEVQQGLATFADIRYTSDLVQPVTFGMRCPVVLLPLSLAGAPDTLRRAVTTHELLHVQRGDWGWVLLEEVLRTVFWFNPATWWLTSRVQQAREEVVDHLTVLAIGSRRDYIEALLAFADASAPAPVPAFARRAHLFTRIMRISKESSMSSVRVLLSGLAMLVVVAGVGVYAQTTFPLRAAIAGGAAQAAADAVVKPITPENPIPRRVFAVPIQHPDGHDDKVAVLQVLVHLDANGVPTVVRSMASGVSAARTAAARQEPQPVSSGPPPAFDAFYRWSSGSTRGSPRRCRRPNGRAPCSPGRMACESVPMPRRHAGAADSGGRVEPGQPGLKPALWAASGAALWAALWAALGLVSGPVAGPEPVPASVPAT
jgi:beta-lactamase regulating signal transducer with metallopeptidase domain